MMFIQRKDFSLHQLVPCVLVLVFFTGTGFSQITWRRTYGGAGYDVGYCVEQTADGGYIVAGVTGSFGNNLQVYLIKTDSLGDTLWTKTYGGAADDFGMYVRSTIDSGYIVVGYTNSFGDSLQIYLIKTDSSGDTLWTRTYGGPRNERGYCVKQTTDGGYIITGGGSFLWGYDPVYLFKTDSMGNVEWNKVYGDTIYSTGTAVQQTSDGGYIITGCYGFYDDVFLIKTDSLGDTLWTKTYGYQFAEGHSVQQTSDGGYIITGFAGARLLLLKADSLGDTIWARTYQGPDGGLSGFSGQQTTDGGYIATGRYYVGQESLQSAYLLKTDSIGDTLWFREYRAIVPLGLAEGNSVQQTTDGGYIIAGYTYPNQADVYLIKTDQNGNVAGLEENKRVQHLARITQPIASPNPFVSFTTVIGYEKERFILYDVSGRQVGSYLGNRIGFGLPAGVYFIMPEDKTLKPVRLVKVKNEER